MTAAWQHLLNHELPKAVDFDKNYSGYDKYPKEDAHKMAETEIGGWIGKELTSGVFNGTCASMICHALLACGQRIPAGVDGANKNFDIEGSKAKYPGGRYILSAGKLSRYLATRYGKPDIAAHKLNPGSDINKIVAGRSIIIIYYAESTLNGHAEYYHKPGDLNNVAGSSMIANFWILKK
jgi:hypothetical protein